MTTPHHAQYWPYALTIQSAPDGVEHLSRAISNARVDLNPHQVEAALFALQSPLSSGTVLADEVGLGKTIEAALVISQRWAERIRVIREWGDHGHSSEELRTAHAMLFRLLRCR